MEQSLKNETELLAHWTYSRGEWMAYLKRSDPKHNLFYFIYRFLYSVTFSSIPEISITNEQVWIGKKIFEFKNRNNKLKNIELKEEGGINVLTIITEKINRKNIWEICLPVPKGRLREAIELQHNLIAVN